MGIIEYYEINGRFIMNAIKHLSENYYKMIIVPIKGWLDPRQLSSGLLSFIFFIHHSYKIYVA